MCWRQAGHCVQADASTEAARSTGPAPATPHTLYQPRTLAANVRTAGHCPDLLWITTRGVKCKRDGPQYVQLYSVKNPFQCNILCAMRFCPIFDLQKATKIKFEATIKVATLFHCPKKILAKAKEGRLYNANHFSYISIMHFSTSFFI